MKKAIISLLLIISIISISGQSKIMQPTYIVVDTGTDRFYSDDSVIDEPKKGEPFYGQDATYNGNKPSYTDNGDGTITDNVTGLMWQKDMVEKITYDEATSKAKNMKLAGYSDWRVPTIKELYSLILFTGQVQGERAIRKFIDEDYFIQPVGNTDNQEREIDAQTWSATKFVGRVMNKQNETVFGVNFIDGRIKSYPIVRRNSPNKGYFRMVRGNPEYGKNNFTDNKDGTISDLATGLMWQKADDGVPRDWKDALAYAEGLELAGYSDWRLPDAKELQSIVDYSRAPSVTASPAIDPIFETSSVSFQGGTPRNFPYFWSSTSHLDGRSPYSHGVYIAFGEALGQMNGQIMDVHGAGAQRSDPKSGKCTDYPQYFGPQGDSRHVYNSVRAVRNIEK